MDISEDYVKMCNHPLIQLDKDGSQLITIFNVVEDVQTYWGRIAYRGDDVFAQIREGSTDAECVRLLRQSQIQLRFDWDSVQVKYFDGVKHFYVPSIAYPRYTIPGETMEQLWLKFYMHETHNLRWVGEEWIE